MTFILLSYYTKATMKLPKQNHIKRKTEAREFWVRVATDYRAGMTPTEIAQRYINPKTNKPYTREHIHWVLNQIRKMPITELEKYMTD